MADSARIMELLGRRREGFSLPQDFYVSDALFEADLEAVFENEWLFACNGCEIPKPGDYLTIEIGRNSVVVLRDRDGGIRAFHNTCRHRGSRVCTHEKGRASVLVCPYHQWSYSLDGSLRGAREMPRDFDKSAYGLKPVRVESICGMIYVCLGADAPDLSGFRAAVTPFIAPHQPERTKVAHATTLVEDANWKLVIENNRECYHCAGNHPELLATLVEFALPDDPAGTAEFQGLLARKAAKWDALGLPHRPAEGGTEFRCIRLPFHEGALSFTSDGRAACRKLLGDFADPDLGSVRMFRVPNNWNHFLSDHIIHFRILPISAGKTALRTTWLVHEEAVEGVDYDIETLTSVWTATNAQDAELAAVNHQGIRSMAYEPGPYAPSEFMLTNFTTWYAEKLARHYGPATPFRVAAE